MKQLLLLAFGLFAACSSFADLIGIMKVSPTARIDLFSEAGVCLGRALKAEYVPDRGLPVAGCWRLSQDPKTVFIVFLDGDIALINVIEIEQPKKL